MGELPLLKYCFLVLFLVWLTDSQSLPCIIQTSTGPIQGSTVNVDGRTVYQYLGIPYAQPPVGDLRFKRPKPIQPWSETLQANKMPPACIQYSELPKPWYDFQGGKSEDCLYLNMWVPEEKCCKCNKAVMFWIHGGAFAYGSNRIPNYNGRVLAARGDVIVVTINYRLGAFGFFTTYTEAAPVNNALYDMLEALKWVNKNIGDFGGDPRQVTVFGESAGSWSTGWFCMSPLTKGLFNRVIMESGSPAFIKFYNKTSSLVISEKLADALGCVDPMTNIYTFPNTVADCMRGKDAFEIAKTLNSFNPNTGILYNPVAGTEFLPLNADEALNSGNFHNVSVLIGNNRDEGSVLVTIYLSEAFGFFGEKLPTLNTYIGENLLKGLVKYILKDIPGTNLIMQTALRRLSADDHRKNLRILYDVLGDFLLVCPTTFFAESFSRYGKDAYFYFFEHRPSTTPWAEWMGVVHYDEVQFVFGSPLKEDTYTDEEVELSKLMINMWSNFAKYGDPFYDELKQSYPSPGGLLKSNQTLDKWPTYSSEIALYLQSNPSTDGLLQSNQRLDKWPKYSREMPLYLILDTTTRKAKRYGFGPHKENCDLLRAVHGFL